MPVGKQDHRVVARAVARALLGSAQKRGDFVAGEVIAEARFAGHANNLPQPPSSSSPRAESRAQVFGAPTELNRPAAR
jgi:hypothetical protein